MVDQPLRYSPETFDCDTIDAAKQIILTASSSAETDRHWREDTPIIAAQLAEHLLVGGGQRVLDFRCGIGRVAKPFMALTACQIVGVDISASMRRMALDYVASPRFHTIAPEDLDEPSNQLFDAAYAVLVIQHCENPELEIRRIRNSLRPDGRFVLVNSTRRWLPTNQGWANDRVDVLAVASQLFRRVASFDPPGHYQPGADELHYGMVFVPR